MSDFHTDCLNEVKRQICTLKLTGLTPKEIAIVRQPWNKKGDGTLVIHRGISIHPEREVEIAGTNKSEDIGYGVGVTMIMPANHALSELGNVTEWRRLIRRKFISQRLSNLRVQSGHVCPCTVEHAEFPRDFDDHKYEISSLLIRVWVRETRS